jgi:hypothetical protein
MIFRGGIIMKNLKKLTAIGMAMAMTISIFTGCSTEGKTLSDAFSKKATSAEFKTEIGLRFTAENLSSEEKEGAAKIIPMVNNSKLTMSGKVNESSDGKTGKLQTDVAVQSGSVPINMSIWADTNLENDKPVVKEIIKVPSVMEPQMNGKQYLVLDTSTMDKDSSTSLNFNKLSSVSEDMQKKLSALVDKSIMNLNPGFQIVTDKGHNIMTLPDGTKDVDVFEVKLDDKSFKNLVKYTSNNLVNNKDARDFLKDYIITVMQASNLKPEELKTSQAEIEKSFSDFEKGLPQFNTEMNNILNAFNGVTLVGDKGIVIDYAIDSDGYIVNEQGNIDLVFDAAKFIPVVQKLSGISTTAAPNKLTGIYNLGIDFNTNTFNINKDVEIKLPEINEQNSIKFENLMKEPTAKKTAMVNVLAAR